jgi:uncharacterized protein (TIGR03435 family)
MRNAKSKIALLTLLATATLTYAQGSAPATPDYTPTLTFDIASIRLSPGVTNGGMKVGVKSPPHSSVFEVSNFPIKALLQTAYGFGTPISGGPDWLSDTYLDIHAKSDPSMDAQMAKLTDDQSKAEKMHMLQALLAERFNLKAHLETRDSSVFALLPAKGGIKVHPVKIDPGAPTPGLQGGGVNTRGGAQGLEFDAKAMSPNGICALLSSQIEAPVIDRTGLTGYFDFDLQFGRDWSAGNPQSWPDIFTAVQEQLGLKLERTRASVPVLVIDHIDKPTAN